MEMRLQRFLAQAGVASRRKAEELITAGRVKVNGRVADELGVKVDPGKDKIVVDGRRVTVEPHAYVVLCKPRGYVTTVSDPEGRPTVMELVKRERGEAHRLYPVGRLDFHTDGVLLLTNDGDLANALMHPRHGVPKTYHAKLRGVVSEEALDRLREGVVLDDGVRTRPAEVMRVLQTDEGGHTWVQITIRQGLNRQIHRMADAIGHPVLKLSRVAYGPITAEGLRPGEWRDLEASEVDALRALARGEPAAPERTDEDEDARARPRPRKPAVRGEAVRRKPRGTGDRSGRRR
jgi:23S rRNA pseudouridine2605 synthase